MCLVDPPICSHWSQDLLVKRLQQWYLPLRLDLPREDSYFLLYVWSALRCMMTCLSTDKTISLFLKGGVSSIITREFIIIFLFVIRFFLAPFWSWFVFYYICKVLDFVAAHSFVFVSSTMMWVIRSDNDICLCPCFSCCL